MRDVRAFARSSPSKTWHETSSADSWIAATCLAYDLPLATLNVKDFADFAEHEGLSLITS